MEIAWGQNLIGCATCRSEYDLLARGREEEHGTIKWDSSVANLGEDAEWSEQQAFVNLPDSWRTLKITIDLKKKKPALGTQVSWSLGLFCLAVAQRIKHRDKLLGVCP